MRALNGKVKHFFHLAAIYDLTAERRARSAWPTSKARSTRWTWPPRSAPACFHHTSSIAAAGLYPGVFREDMFDEAEGLDDPYLRTKHDSEGLVRNEKRIKWRIYRPGMVVGHSQTGEMDKIDGPYYFFTFIKKLREMLPQWMPTLGIEGGRINIVPVDFVVDAMDHIAHKPKLDGHTFHLTDPEPHARRRGAQHLRARRPCAGNDDAHRRAHVRVRARRRPRARSATCRRCERFIGMLLRDFSIPKEVLKFITYPTRFDNRETERALQGQRDRGAARWTATPGACGTTGSATWIRTCSSTASLQGQGAQQGRA